MVKEDSFGLFGWAREGGADRRGKRELGEGARTDAGAGGGRGIASPKVGAKAEARGRGGKWRPGEGGRRAA